MKLYDKYKTLLSNYGLNTPLRISHFMAQIEHESNLTPIGESLNYSKERLLTIFPKYFTKDYTINKGTEKEKLIFGTAHYYARKPEKIANRVYANRMGNGDENSGDGYKYRGRGFIQLTGRQNYEQISKDTEINFIENPDIILLTEANAMVSALWFWKKNNLNKYADIDYVIENGVKNYDYALKSITKIINGGYNGLEHRKLLLIKYKKELGL